MTIIVFVVYYLWMLLDSNPTLMMYTTVIELTSLFKNIFIKSLFMKLFILPTIILLYKLLKIVPLLQTI